MIQPHSKNDQGREGGMVGMVYSLSSGCTTTLTILMGWSTNSFGVRGWSATLPSLTATLNFWERALKGWEQYIFIMVDHVLKW